MSRKHYVRIAQILAGVGNYDDRRQLARDFAVMLKEDNPNFNYSRFMAACNVEVW